MTLNSVWRLILQSIARSKKNFLMSALGIVVGISTFVFFIGLGEGIKDVVLGRIFIVDQIEVVPRRFDTGLVQLGSNQPLNDEVVEQFEALPGVVEVSPKMKLTFPASGYGGKAFFGHNVRAEIIADGIEPSLIDDALTDPSLFTDWEAERRCDTDPECPAGRRCEAGVCQKTDCRFNERTYLTDCPGESYCARDTKQCETPIPFVVSNHLLELYNGSLATALSGSGNKVKMPRLSKSSVLGFQLNVNLGRSFLGRSKRAKDISRRIKLVGFTDKAITVGVTLPLAYVRRFNQRFSGEETASQYHSVILKLSDQTKVPAVVQAVKTAGFDLASSTENAERAANIIRTVESVFALISFLIVGIAAVNISQMFFMIIYQRKREIGLMRALGASKNNVRMLILGEASLIGIAGSLMGMVVGWGAAHLLDALAAGLPDFPYKPDSFFQFPMWLWFASVLGAVLFCLVGAFFPANTAANQEPAEALTD